MNLQEWKTKLAKSVQDVTQYVGLHKGKAIASVITITLLAGGTAYGHQWYEAKMVDIYYVYLHGEEVGVVNSPEVVENWFQIKERSESNRYEGMEIELDKDITYKREKVYKGTFNNAAALDAIASTIEVKAKAFKLVIDGEFIGYVKDEQTAERILQNLKEQYTENTVVTTSKDKKTVSVASISDEQKSSSAKPSYEVKEITIKEDVQVDPTVIDPSEMTSEEEILRLLQKGTLEEKTYKVQQGDCLGCIANKFGLRTAELIQLNPGISENTVLQINQELSVTALKPKVTVQSIAESTTVEDIPYTTEYVEDSSLYKGESRVKQEGVNGQKEVTYSIKKENGIEISRETLQERVLSKPITRIIRKGTKPLPAVASGIFKWPTVGGIITSKYGWRWGKMHTGLDISGVKDKTIMASDNGTVTFAGWDGELGYYIVIDHGGGYETLYAHMASLSVKDGQKVAKGQKIGVMGNTGRSTGTHLHFEIIKNGKKVNPSDAFE